MAKRRLSDLTDVTAIAQAIAECRTLGVDAFLDRYGFKPERSYALIDRGEPFPSKAIAGAAYGFQHPERGAMTWDEFSGGVDHAVRRLRDLGFEVAEERLTLRNPPWTRDELILALDLYFRGGRRVLDDDDPEVVALSQVLNRLPIHRDRDATFRNPNGVAMKLGNFRRHDPSSTGGKGLERGNALEPVIWADFADDPARLRATAAAIVAAIDNPAARVASDDEGDEDEGALEGRVLERLHRARERKRDIVAKKKARAGERPACEVCGFDFFATYGARGARFIECHHTRPLSQLAEGEKTRLADLALVCANCHRMLHRRPWLGVAELRAALATQR